MGKLQYDPVIQHFSHPHPLHLTTPEQAQTTGPCNGCRLQPSGWIYTCAPCSYVLHLSCSQMPQLIHHPCDLNHSLSLLSKPAYPEEGFFNCNACGQRGDAFSYHCTPCDLDIHITCASMPLSLDHPSHHHPLTLSFFPPYRNKGFSCDICRNLGSNHWLYRCNACEFDAHLLCASMKPKPLEQAQAQFQQQRSMGAMGRATTTVRPRYLLQPQSRRSGYQQPNFYARDPKSGFSPVMMTSQPAAPIMNGPQADEPMMMVNGPQFNQPMNMMNAPAGNTNGGMMDQAIQGFMNSAAQQLSQTLVQSIMGGGSGGNDAGASGGGGGDSVVVSCDFGAYDV